MRRLQDVKGEESLDVLADILDYVVTLVQNETVKKAIEDDGLRNIKTIKTLIKEGKHEIVSIMAVIDGKSYDEFVKTLDLLTLPVMLYQTFNDEALQAVFTSQAQQMGVTSSGLATETTEEDGK